MRKLLFVVAAGLLCAAGAQAAEMYPWRQHLPPCDFRFGNEIDGHQQTAPQRDGSLSGYLYVRQTGVTTSDGYPVATHADCSRVADCYVGWRIEGKPAVAKLVHHAMHDHPLFWIGRADIPQPGGYSHFHWTGAPMPMPYLPAGGFVLQLTAANDFCFIHHGAEAASSAASCRDNGGIKVQRGADNATHLNIVTSDPNG